MCEGSINEPMGMTSGVPDDVATLRMKLISMLEGIQASGQGATPFRAELSAPPNPLQTQAAGLMGRLMGSGASQPWEPRIPPEGPPPGEEPKLPPEWPPIGPPPDVGTKPPEWPPIGPPPGGGDSGGSGPIDIFGMGNRNPSAYNPTGAKGQNPLLGMVMGMRNRQQSAYNPRGY